MERPEGPMVPIATLVLGLYAVVMLSGGVYAFVAAPPEANRGTALIVPSVCAFVMGVLAILVARGRRTSRRGRPLVFTAGVLALLFAGAISTPARAREARMQNYAAAAAAWADATRAEPALEARAAAEPGVRKAFFAERGSPDHDQTYLVNTLWTLCAASVATALALFGLAVFAKPRAS